MSRGRRAVADETGASTSGRGEGAAAMVPAPGVEVSVTVGKLRPSKTVQLTDIASQLKADGVDVIAMTAGEPDFATPRPIIDAAVRAMNAGLTGYAPNAGLPALKAAICEKLKEDNGILYEPSDIVVSCGAKQCVTQAILATCGAGDEVIIPSPFWVSYPEMATLAGADSVIIPTREEDDFLLTPDQLREAITPRSRILILCSPSNPTGAVYHRERLLELARVVCAHPRLLVLSDEIYEHIIYSPHRHVSIAGVGADDAENDGLADNIFQRTIVVNGFSKAFAMTGWRLGYVASKQYATAIAKVQSQITSGASTIAQHAALEALPLRKPRAIGIADKEDDIDSGGRFVDVGAMVRSYERRRDLLVRLLREIDGITFNVPAGAFYLFVNVSAYLTRPGRLATAPACGNFEGGSLLTDDDLCRFLLSHSHLAVIPGSAFGCEGNIRLSYAVSEDNIVRAAGLLKASLAAIVVR